MFQSTRPRGRTRQRQSQSTFYRQVSIHASSREDATIFRTAARPAACFNPRVLAGGRDLRFFFQSCIPDCFNPRVLAGGRDTVIPRWIHQRNVSIHASSREDATRGASCRGVSPRFQSTRPRGRTRPCDKPESDFLLCFNPRVLAGGRDAQESKVTEPILVSIHASSREDATKSDCKHDATKQFQSTRPRGRTRPA